ncbi:MAG TPA: HAMP domain-containing sensor histidine kinase [Bacteroidia bacterium]|nr:HAMP domain-containing sensor histidine kinase [Bacteroidia bacterium]HNS11882.1 HAMP domain-containing sensor histidine kinase [Bacteroidia bacterium]
MKLQVKLALYNTLSKVIIILGIGLFLPKVIEQIVYNHIDKRLEARLEKMMRMIQIGGLDEIALDQDCSFESYSVFKEEYVAISPLAIFPHNFGDHTLVNTERIIEKEVIKHRVLAQAFIYDNQLYTIEIGEGLSTIDQLTLTIRKFSFRIMLAVILLFVFLDFGFVQILLRPFHRIVKGKLKEIRHPEKYDPRPIHTSTTEFVQLNKAIDEMMVKIQETFRVEREFITNVSHELLTPTSILKNRLENIMNEPGLPNEVLSQLAESQRTLSRLTRIVKALLYISKIENAQYIKNEISGIKTLVDDVLEELSDRIEERRINLSTDISDKELTSLNLSLIHTMLFNLISNAIKYNKEGGNIIIKGNLDSGKYILSIADTGVGILPENIPHIFDRFKRFRPEDDMSYGLGLPIVKTIADFHDIKISVESVKDLGCKFILEFPTEKE